MRGLGLSELAARVSHAAQKRHMILKLEIVVDAVAVRLHGPAEAKQLGTRYLPRPRSVQVEEVKLVAPGPAVAELPGVSSAALPGRVGYAPGNLVYLQVVAREDVAPQRLVKGLKPGGDGVHPSVEGGDGKPYAEFGVLPDLAVFGQVVMVLVDDDLRQQVGSYVIAADDGLRGRSLAYARAGDVLVRLPSKNGPLSSLNGSPFFPSSNLCRRAMPREIPSISRTSSSQRIERKPMPWRRKMRGWKRPCSRRL